LYNCRNWRAERQTPASISPDAGIGEWQSQEGSGRPPDEEPKSERKKPVQPAGEPPEHVLQQHKVELQPASKWSRKAHDAEWEKPGEKWNWDDQEAQAGSWSRYSQWARSGWKSERTDDDHAGQTADKERPVAWDIMCGPNFPVRKALRWCGWTVETFDTEISPDHDF